jgi:hypothetical protein
VGSPLAFKGTKRGGDGGGKLRRSKCGEQIDGASIAEKLVNTAVPSLHTRNYPKTVKGLSGSAFEESKRSRGKIK